MNRRTALAVLAAAAAGRWSETSAESNGAAQRCGMGLVVYCCGIRAASLKRRDPGFNLFDPFRFLEHCRSVGAGGMQAPLGSLDEASARKLRDMAAAADMYIEASTSPPRDAADAERFEHDVKIAQQAGALAIRTVVMPGRRYERFDSLDEFQELTRQAIAALQRAAPIVEKYRVPLAVENHKDHRSEQRVEQLERISSEYVGACLDTGNSVALLEDPLETAVRLAPWAKSVHLKDQALAPYEEGFLLADIPLGQGCLPLKQIVAVIRKAQPHIRFSLELITRDPLKVPVFSDKYWATLGDLPAVELARMLRTVRDHAHPNLPYVSSLAPDAQLALEDAHVRDSLDYARNELGI